MTIRVRIDNKKRVTTLTITINLDVIPFCVAILIPPDVKKKNVEFILIVLMRINSTFATT